MGFKLFSFDTLVFPLLVPFILAWLALARLLSMLAPLLIFPSFVFLPPLYRALPFLRGVWRQRGPSGLFMKLGFDANYLMNITRRCVGGACGRCRLRRARARLPVPLCPTQSVPVWTWLQAAHIALAEGHPRLLHRGVPESRDHFSRQLPAGAPSDQRCGCCPRTMAMLAALLVLNTGAQGSVCRNGWHALA